MIYSSSGIPIGPILLFLLLIFYPIFTNYTINKTKSNSYFILSNKRVVFRSWNLWKGIKFDIIKLNEVEKVVLETFKDGNGTIYMMGIFRNRFKNTEHYPALLSIKEPEKVFKLFENLLEK